MNVTNLNFENGNTYLELGISLNDLLLDHPNATFVGLASGDSMNGVGIFDGDLLLVDRAIKERHGDIVVAQYNNEFICKQLDLNNRCLVSANAEFKPVSIGPLDKFTLEGVVTKSIRLHRKTRQLF